jgi:hypothetical protein
MSAGKSKPLPNRRFRGTVKAKVAETNPIQILTMFESPRGSQCPNCGQFKIEQRSGVLSIVKAMFASAIFIITLPLELFLIPALLVAALMPSQRKTHRFCRNCKWSDGVTSTHQPKTT